MLGGMTDVLITIDTEYSHLLASRPRPASREENFARSITCETPDGPAGVGYKLDLFDRHGLKGVFFVDPMPALVWGVAAIEDVVGPIVARGHDVQLHLHTEWLSLAGSANPVGNRTGHNMKDFSFEDQCTLIDMARDLLVAAGAPPPIAFRAGNYGANDDTLRALAQLGFTHETSHPPGIENSSCEISLGPEDRRPLRHCGITEVPIGCIDDFGAGLRHAQITALSAWEMLAALRFARDNGVRNFTFVSHSFELMCRRRRRTNRLVRKRFEKLCAGIEAMEGVRTATYSNNPPEIAQRTEPRPVLPLSEVGSGLRVLEQVVANTVYGG